MTNPIPERLGPALAGARTAQLLLRGAAALILATLLVLAAVQMASAQAQTLFDNGNVYAVENQPTQPTLFTLSAPTQIASIRTYHWNYGRGARPGRIVLRDQTGRIYGPWRTFGSPGQGGVPNAYWTAYVNAVLPPGTYLVIDSDPATWAHNAATGGAGMVAVEGYGE